MSIKKRLFLIFTIFISAFSGIAQVIPQDSLALVDLYYSLNGHTWTNQSNWLTGRVTTWGGIAVLGPDSTRVGGIVIANNNIHGSIPLSIGNLSELRGLVLAHCQLTGTIPHTIGRLKKCETLTLWYNQLSGQITDSIGNMTMLRYLHLDHNNFTGYFPSTIFSLNLLYLIWLYNNQLDSLPDFSQAPTYSHLDLEVANNLLTFEDLEPNMVVHTFTISPISYAPQFDSINYKIDTTVMLGTTFQAICTIGGANNIYQWTKDGVDIPNATNSVLTLANVLYADTGIYSCNVSNTTVPDLDFHRRPIILHVDKTIGIKENSENYFRFSTYPNPSNNVLNIEISFASAGQTKIILYDFLGNTINIIDEGFFDSKHITTDVSFLPNGVYLIKVEHADKTILKKLTIIK